MKFLFFFVHPAKFHLFRNTINSLLNDGNDIEILITSKDILEDLVKTERWKYKNIFPEGRKINWLPTKVGASINLVRTLYRLFKITKGKKYDLFVTDDLLTFIGRLKGIPTIHFQDDDLKIVPESAILLSTATNILAPQSTDLGKYNSKKIAFNGYKELAYLHPNNFVPNIEIVKKINPEIERYFVIRVVLLKSTHDVGKKGIDDKKLKRLVALLLEYGKVYITSERKLESKFEKYRININYTDISHILYYADMFIGDSQTMCSEAAVLGTPSIRFNDFVGKINVMDEKELKYELSYGFKTNEFEKMLNKIKELLVINNLKDVFAKRREQMLRENVDLTEFMIKLFSTYPRTISAKKKI